ncbi:PTS glucose transporter subunit IIA [Arcanobacterium haemolyticum]|nr:PTS glucose transporter subunit IIA [Arcanobacterium haemolyticum]
MELTLLAPVSGTVVPMNEVPDEVFADGLVGPGMAIEPFPGGLTVLSPCAGVVRKAIPHGGVIETDEGVNVLIHMGLDTVKLRGAGFTMLVRPDQHVEAGQPIVLWTTSVAENEGFSLCSPIVVLGADKDSIEVIPEKDTVEAGKPFLRVTVKEKPNT